MRKQLSPQDGYAVVIDSIGTASPVIHRLLAEGLGVPSEVMLKSLYHAPSVMARNMEEATADQSVELLTRLGLEARVLEPGAELPDAPELVDVALYLEDAAKLPALCLELCEFLGCDQKSVLDMLQAEPCLILGGVSSATAEAMKRRISAELMVSNPRKATYTLQLGDLNPVMRRHMAQHLRSLRPEWGDPALKKVRGMTYDQAQKIWSRFQSAEGIGLINEDFQRFELILTALEEGAEGYRACLRAQTGMPEEIVDQVLANLPVQLEASVSRARSEELLPRFAEAGLRVERRPVTAGPRQLTVYGAKNWDKAREVLERFLPADRIPKKAKMPCVSPQPMGDLLTRYAMSQLEAAGCAVDCEPLNEAK